MLRSVPTLPRAAHEDGSTDTSASCGALGSGGCRCPAPQRPPCRGWYAAAPSQHHTRHRFQSPQGAFLGIFAVAGINQALEPVMDTSLLIPSLGATAVLVFGVPESKLSQPRNVLCGQVLSAIVGIATRNVLGSVLWVSAPVGMSLALLAMRLTSTTHPPGALLVVAVHHDTLPAHRRCDRAHCCEHDDACAVGGVDVLAGHHAQHGGVAHRRAAGQQRADHDLLSTILVGV